MLARLGLGTVQFGQDYGVSNRGGRPDEREVAAILAQAAVAGVGYIDTAPADGDAETLVAGIRRGNNLRIVTKTSALTGDRIERGTCSLSDTLAPRVIVSKWTPCTASLCTRAATRKAGAGNIVDAMCEAKSRGWTSRIGASIYNDDQLARRKPLRPERPATAQRLTGGESSPARLPA